MVIPEMLAQEVLEVAVDLAVQQVLETLQANRLLVVMAHPL
jgi:hypothetical protein